jgi:16S rRNA (cytidine1402-2'-O)-methyltransferase
MRAKQNLDAPGTLYIVGTPIGNLEDLTLRALRVLKEVALIGCEDTRQTLKLLNHYGITTPTISYHEHNEPARASQLVERLENGASVALVSDAGMPGVSDPGYRVIKLAVDRGIPVVPVPGPAAFLAALAGSGLAGDAFEFSGFLPAKVGQRGAALSGLRDSQRTHLFYEAPHRLLETLTDIVEILGPERPVVVARELTKIHEEFVRGTADEVLRAFQQRPGGVKGEITLLIAKAERQPAPIERANLQHRLEDIRREQNLDEKAALKSLAREMGLSKSEAYRRLQRARKRK